MKISTTAIPGPLIIEPRSFDDSRGFFTELYQSERYAKAGIPACFVQDNLSRSARGVLRGLHIQNPNPQGKLVTVLRGAVIDVAVDVRTGSPTFGEHVKVELNEDNRRQFWIPRGFAHGLIVMSDAADFFYKCDALYSPQHEMVVKWNDPALAINWGQETPEVSQRDQDGKTLAECQGSLPRYEMA